MYDKASLIGSDDPNDRVIRGENSAIIVDLEMMAGDLSALKALLLTGAQHTAK